MSALPPRLRLAACACLLAVATACGDGNTALPAQSPVSASAGQDAAVAPAPPAQGDDAASPSARPSRAPTVPLLHQSVDGYPETIVTIQTATGEVTLAVKVAETRPQRRHGLMEVPEVPDGTGMLFVYSEPTEGAYYMLDTLVPLDIAFVGADGDIIATFAMDPCPQQPCPTYGPDEQFTAALEVPQGWFQQVGVGVGDHVSWGRISTAGG